MDKIRASAVGALVITALGIVYAAGCAVSGWQPSLGWLLQAVLHIGELLAVVALALICPVTTRIARTGLGLAMAGQVILAIAEVVYPRQEDTGNILFGIGPILTGVGLIATGVGIVRSGAWLGWRRWVPLVLGVYTIIVLIPVLIGSGGPPAPAALWTIAGWDVLWLAVAVAVLTRSARPAETNRADARVTVR